MDLFAAITGWDWRISCAVFLNRGCKRDRKSKKVTERSEERRHFQKRAKESREKNDAREGDARAQLNEGSEILCLRPGGMIFWCIFVHLFGAMIGAVGGFCSSCFLFPFFSSAEC